MPNLYQSLPPMLQITSKEQDFLVFIVILVSIALFFLASVIFLFSLRRRSAERYRIQMPAMQETVKPARREKDAASRDEEAAVVAAALAVCMSEKPEAAFRVVSFKRTR